MNCPLKPGSDFTDRPGSVSFPKMEEIHANPPFRLGHRRWLDGFRGVAILLVLGMHLGWIKGGSFGVDLFFVLSGFLITTLLIEEWNRTGSISLRSFYLRRMARLLPAFGLMLVGCLSYACLALPSEELAGVEREAVVSALYVSNWPTLHQVKMTVMPHTWSLAVEEQFYILWPLLLLLLLRAGLSIHGLITLLILGIFASAAWKAWLFSFRTSVMDERAALVFRVYQGLDTRLDALFTGCLVGAVAADGFLPNGSRLLRLSSWIAIAALAWICSRCHFGQTVFYNGGFTLVAGLAGLLIVRMLAGPSPVAERILGWSPLVYCGRISYGLYLFHMPLLHWMKADAAAIAVCLALASASFHLVEQPIMRWSRRHREILPS